MDNLTHTLAGAILGEAGLKRRTALAMPTLLIGANLPDLDVLAIPFGHSLDFRRGWTHGVLALVVLPILLTLAILAWDRLVRRRGGRIPERPVDRRAVLLLSYVAVLSHPFLDWLNNYGLRWLMPFDGTWFYGDALFIVDPWVLLLLAGGVVMARRRKRTAGARVMIALGSAYIVAMLGSATAGRVMVRDALRAEGFSVDQVMVGPVAVDPNRRQVIVREGADYHTGTLRWLPRPRLRIDDGVVRVQRDHPMARRAEEEPQVARFLRWSRFPFFEVEERGDHAIVVVDDLRYGSPGSRSWAAVEVAVPVAGPVDRAPALTATGPRFVTGSAASLVSSSPASPPAEVTVGSEPPAPPTRKLLLSAIRRG